MIAGRLAGSTDNEIKNYWNTHIKRKLLNKGIDPLTHRPLNGNVSSHSDSSSTTPNSTTTTISFSTTKNPKKEQVLGLKDKKFNQKMQQNRIERCPDLNLDLRISPPYQQNQEIMRTGTRICFTCSLGLEKSQDCNCSQNGGSISYDFFGLTTNGALDYRSLEMM
ncbi:unnamed protein product [Amaranthus hypochondriacus]